MTGRNPWVVLGVPEDSPYDEIQRAYRRRVKQTHPDSGGDACQFATVVRAFDAVRQPLRPRRDPPDALRPLAAPGRPRGVVAGRRVVGTGGTAPAGRRSGDTGRVVGGE